MKLNPEELIVSSFVTGAQGLRLPPTTQTRITSPTGQTLCAACPETTTCVW
jgi:hypothetical protein